MICIGYFILIFTAIQLVISLVNLLTKTHLPRTGSVPEFRVSVLIPARNEENNIGNIIRDLQKQKYEDIEVIIFNDQSDDKTVETAEKLISHDSRFSLINSEGLPEGWLGKNHACHSLAKQARGDFFLFLDADVRISDNVISDAINFSQDTGSELVSVFPEQIIKSPGEWITVPNMNYILVSLLPLVLVRKSAFPSLAAANGQFMFFRADSYRQVMPHELMKNHKVEDIAIARFFKKKNRTVSCLLGDERITCRMYRGFTESVNGFSKNVTEFFGNSYLLAILFWLVTTFGFIIILFYFPVIVFLTYLTMYLSVRIAISISGRQNIVKNLLWLVPLQISMGIFIQKSITNKISGSYQWKGRKTG